MNTTSSMPRTSDNTSDVHPRRDAPLTNSPVLNNYLEALRPRLEQSTLKGYAQDLRLVTSSGKNLTNWPQDYVSWRLASAVSRRTINLEVQAWNSFLRWQGKEPPTWKPLKHVPSKIRRSLTGEEIDRLARASKARWPVWKAYLLTGARMSELQNLLQEDIDLESRTLTIRDAKRGERIRAVPIHSEALDIFENWETLRNALPSNLSRTFRRDSRKANIKGIDLHCLRVTFITRLIQGGTNPQTVQRLAGHSNITTTLRYYLRCPHKDDQIALERLTI